MTYVDHRGRGVGSSSARRTRRAKGFVLTALVAPCMLAMPSVARAASQTWTGAGGDGLWLTGANWSGGAAPGAVTTLNNDVATFNGGVGPVTPIVIDNQRNL